MFGEGGQGGKNPVPGRDENYTLSTQLLDAINGATRRLTLPDGRTLDVKIPPGTVEGQVLRLHGQGGEGRNGAPRGDAFIAIHIEPHRYFERDGNDVRLMLPVTLTEAVIGGSVQVPTPRGAVMMRIPPNSDSGTELRLRGRGVPEHRGKPAGDLYATLRVIIGTQDKSLQEFLAGWKPENPVNPRRSMEETP
jgi:DnaJ-class molecular chaperone